MKQKRIFLSVWIMLLSVISITICSFYPSSKMDKENMHKTIQNVLGDELFFYALSMNQFADEQWSYPRFSNFPEKSHFEDEYISLMDRAVSCFQNDENVQYIVYDANTKKRLAANVKDDLSENDSMFYGIGTFKKDGSLQLSGDFGNYTNGAKDYLVDCMNTFIRDPSLYDQKNDAKVSFRNDFTVVIRIPEKLTNNGTYVYDTIYDRYEYTPYVFIAMGVGACILALFILLVPIRIVEQCQPFKIFAQIKFEINSILACCLITFGCMGVVVLSNYTMNGLLAEILLRYEMWDGISLLANLAAWMLLFAYLSIIFFLLKYIIAHGVIRYLKEDTFIGSIIRRFKHYVNALADVELDKLNQSLIKLLLINLLIVIIFCSLQGFGIILSFGYTIALFFWLRDKLKEVKLEYQELLENAKAMEEGRFDYEYTHVDGVFKELQQELTQVRSGFEKAVREETKSQLMKTELISNVSHDLKTPLTGMRNYVELLQDTTLSEETRTQYVQMLAQYTQRLSRLIEDLFEVSKVNSGNIQLNLMELDVKALIEQAQAECSELLQEKHLQVITSFDQEQYLVALDGDKTMRIFENLFINIGKYALANTRVYVMVKAENETVIITMKNISAEPLNFDETQIVERFQRGDSSRHGEGSGLGLAIVKSFTEIQNGQFHIEVDGDLFKAIVQFALPSDANIN